MPATATGTAAAPAAAPVDTAPPPLIASREAFEAGVFTRDCVEVGDEAVWAVSSAKHGNGVTQLCDGDDATFWQSDDALPHTISIRFPRLTCVNKVAIHLNAAADESYTPKRLAVFCGTHEANAVEVAAAEVESPDGWLILELSDGLAGMASMAAMAAKALAEMQQQQQTANQQNQSESDNANNNGSSSSSSRLPIRINEAVLSASTITGGADAVPSPNDSSVWCTFVRVVILENHQNGRDSHVRGVSVFGPAPPKKYATPYFESYDGLR